MSLSPAVPFPALKRQYPEDPGTTKKDVIFELYGTCELLNTFFRVESWKQIFDLKGSKIVLCSES